MDELQLLKAHVETLQALVDLQKQEIARLKNHPFLVQEPYVVPSIPYITTPYFPIEVPQFTITCDNKDNTALSGTIHWSTETFKLITPHTLTAVPCG